MAEGEWMFVLIFVRFHKTKCEYFVKNFLILKEILGIYALLVEISANFV